MIKKLIEPNLINITIMQLLLPVFLYIGIISNVAWYWWASSFIFYFLFTAIGNNVGMHRFYCHYNFKMSRPMEYFVLWCGATAGLGSPMSYINTHLIHHKYNDTELDSHGPVRGWKSVLYYFHRHIQPSETVFSRTMCKLIVRFSWLHHYYWLLLLAQGFIMYLIDWKIMLFCWLIPASITLWVVAIVLVMQHDANGPSNTRSYQWFAFGEAWHRNHHINPALVNHAIDPTKIDWTYHLCRLVAKKGSIG